MRVTFPSRIESAADFLLEARQRLTRRHGDE
jgi:hypothetical protein